MRIEAADRAAVGSLVRRGISVTSVHLSEAGGYEVRGVLTLEEAGALVDDGFPVLIRRNARAESTPVTVEAEEWLAAVVEDLEAESRED